MIFKKPKSKLQKAVSRAFLIIFGAVLAGGILYITVYRPLQISNEKKNFEKARQSIEELYTKIEAKIGKPDQIKREQSCGYSSTVFGQGHLGCAVSINTSYSGLDHGSASSYLLTTSNIIGTNLSELGSNVGPVFSSGTTSTKKQSFDSSSSLVCTISYTYPTEVQGQSFEIDIVCGGSAKAEHYPVKSN